MLREPPSQDTMCSWVSHPIITRNMLMRVSDVQMMHVWPDPRVLRSTASMYPLLSAADREDALPDLKPQAHGVENVEALEGILTEEDADDKAEAEAQRELLREWQEDAEVHPRVVAKKDAEPSDTMDHAHSLDGAPIAMRPLDQAQWTVDDFRTLPHAQRIFIVRALDSRDGKFRVIVRSNSCGTKAGRNMGNGGFDSFLEAELFALKCEVDFAQGTLTTDDLRRRSHHAPSPRPVPPACPARPCSNRGASTKVDRRRRSPHPPTGEPVLPASTGDAPLSASPHTDSRKQKRRRVTSPLLGDVAGGEFEGLILRPLPAIEQVVPCSESQLLLDDPPSIDARLVCTLRCNQLERVRARLRYAACLRVVLNADFKGCYHTMRAQYDLRLHRAKPATLRRWLDKAKAEFAKFDVALEGFFDLRNSWQTKAEYAQWMRVTTLRLSEKDRMPQPLTHSELPLSVVSIVDDKNWTRLYDPSNSNEWCVVRKILGELYYGRVPYTRAELAQNDMVVVVVCDSSDKVRGVMVLCVFSTETDTRFVYIKSIVVTKTSRRATKVAAARRPKHGRRLLQCAHLLAVARKDAQDGVGYVVAQCIRAHEFHPGTQFWQRTTLETGYRAAWIGAQLLHTGDKWPHLDVSEDGWPTESPDAAVIDSLDPICVFSIAQATRGCPMPSACDGNAQVAV
jgi:hypothetical protein